MIETMTRLNTGKNLNKNSITWQQELADGFSNLHDLCNYLGISPTNAQLLTSTNFPLRVPREFADRMEKNNLNDPLLKQILPVKDEAIDFPGFNSDPVGDIKAMAETGVIHKYHGRVLFITTGSCAINCRYCFRRNFPYSDFQLSAKKTNQALQYIQQNPDISEIILSGGDPLLLNDQKLFSLLHQLDKINHLKRIRIHTRIPIVLPSRINSSFCNSLSSIKKPIVLVVHSNHKNELNAKVKQACYKIKHANITLLNQSVLLKGINDNAAQLCALSESLFDCGILPYYLHLLDKATGTGHFEVDQNLAIDLMNQIKKQLPGYLVPKLVKEQAGAANKITIA
ncbi:MAG: EF-P beta-lysylation protein EpmB [Methylococcaceae bacterium]